jgi:hypothetical protein
VQTRFNRLKFDLKWNWPQLAVSILFLFIGLGSFDPADATEVLGPSGCGPASYAKLAIGFEHSAREELAKSFSKNARNDIQIKLRRSFDEWNNTLPPARRTDYGFIQPISKFDLPPDRRISALVQRANSLLQTESVILDFAEDTAKRAADQRLLTGTANFDPKRLISAKSRDVSMLQKMADEQGWGKIEDEWQRYQPEMFRYSVLMRGRLWIESSALELGHPGAAHALQWLMITPHLDAEFGPGAAKELFTYLSTREGFHLWETVFDQGKGYVRDLRGPQAWGSSGFLGTQSWLGLE